MLFIKKRITLYKILLITLKKIITILTKDFVYKITKLTYRAGCQRFTPPRISQIPIILDLQQVLKFLLYFQKASEESNITKQKNTIWRLGKNNFD